METRDVRPLQDATIPRMRRPQRQVSRDLSLQTGTVLRAALQRAAGGGLWARVVSRRRLLQGCRLDRLSIAICLPKTPPSQHMGKRKADFVDLAASSEDDGDTAGPSRRGQGPGGGPSGSARVVLPPAGVGARPPQRKAKAKGKPKQEKRVDAAGNTVRFASKPSIQVQERIDRALSRGAGEIPPPP